MKRAGSFAIYLEPWHADIEDFLDLKKNTGVDSLRARDLFYALWIPDLFMKRVENDEIWSLMCPHESPGLWDVHSEEFNDLYTKYEQESKYKQQIPARKLWLKILESQIETGTPYILFKDACNQKNNQKNLGTIRSSNLCSEIIQFSSKDETAVCNLASLSLPAFVNDDKTYNFEKLGEVAYQATKNLNRVIDVNYYPTVETERSNMKHRPMALGISGLADVFMLLELAYDSEEASLLNKNIFETIYFYSLKASCDMAKIEGPYETFKGSPFSQGILQFDLWDTQPSSRYDWNGLKEDIMNHGTRNSMLSGLMPTASCFLVSCQLKTSEGIKSYQQIMNENDIDWKSIEETNEQRWISFKNPILVETRNGLKEAYNIFYNGHVETLDIEMEDGSIFTCSYNHKFLVNRYGIEMWVRADELVENDDIVTYDTNVLQEKILKNIENN